MPAVVPMTGQPKPPFTRDQIVSASDVVRNWRAKVEPRLREHPYVLVLSGADPKVAIMPYDAFEALWQRAERAGELALRVEVLERALHAASSGQPLVPLAELMAKVGLSAEDVGDPDDVDIEEG